MSEEPPTLPDRPIGAHGQSGQLTQEQLEAQAALAADKFLREQELDEVYAIGLEEGREQGRREALESLSSEELASANGQVFDDSGAHVDSGRTGDEDSVNPTGEAEGESHSLPKMTDADYQAFLDRRQAVMARMIELRSIRRNGQLTPELQKEWKDLRHEWAEAEQAQYIQEELRRLNGEQIGREGNGAGGENKADKPETKVAGHTQGTNETPDTTPEAGELPPVPSETESIKQITGLNPAVDDELRFEYKRVNLEADAKRLAKQYADARYREFMQNGGRMTRLAKTLVFGRLLEKPLHAKYETAYDKEVRGNNGQIYAPLVGLLGMDRAEALRASNEAIDATLERVFHGEGELRRGDLEADAQLGDVGAEGQIRDALKDLTVRYARGELNRQSLFEERDKLFSSIDGLSQDLFGRGLYTADTLLQLAEDVRASVEHGSSMERVQAALDRMELKGAFGHSGAVSEVHVTKVDQMLSRFGDKVRRSAAGGTAIATGVGMAAAFVSSSTGRFAQSTLGKALGLGVLTAPVFGATVTGLAERGAFRRQVQGAQYDLVYGIEHDVTSSGARGRLARGVSKVFGDPEKQRAAIEKTLYNTVSVPDVTARMYRFFDTEGVFRTDLSVQELFQAQALVSQLQEVVTYGETEGIDLLRFSGVAQAPVEQREFRMTLLQLGAELKVLQQDTAAVVDILDHNGNTVGTRNRTELLVAVASRVSGEKRTALENERVAKDSTQAELERKRVALAAVRGAVIGAGAGLAMQEVVGWFSPNVNAIGQSSGGVNTTLRSVFGGDQEVIQNPHGQSSQLFRVPNSNISFKIPDDLQVGVSANGAVEVSAPNGGGVLYTLDVDPATQSLSQTSIDTLKDEGWALHESVQIVNGPVQSTNSSGLHDYFQSTNQLVESQNSLFMNNTVGSDYNEFGLGKGGVDGGWFDADGNVRVTLDGLTADGSFQGSTHVDALQALDQGRLKVFMSLNPENPHDNIVVDVVRNGDNVEAVITDPVVKQLFADSGSSAPYDFLGQYMGVAQDNGPGLGGVHGFDVLASIRGSGAGEFQVQGVPVETVTYTITAPDEIIHYDTLPVIGIPYDARNSLSQSRRSSQETAPEVSPPTPTQPPATGQDLVVRSDGELQPADTSRPTSQEPSVRSANLGITQAEQSLGPERSGLEGVRKYVPGEKIDSLDQLKEGQTYYTTVASFFGAKRFVTYLGKDASGRHIFDIIPVKGLRDSRRPKHTASLGEPNLLAFIKGGGFSQAIPESTGSDSTSSQSPFVQSSGTPADTSITEPTASSADLLAGSVFFDRESGADVRILGIENDNGSEIVRYELLPPGGGASLGVRSASRASFEHALSVDRLQQQSTSGTEPRVNGQSPPEQFTMPTTPLVAEAGPGSVERDETIDDEYVTIERRDDTINTAPLIGKTFHYNFRRYGQDNWIRVRAVRATNGGVGLIFDQIDNDGNVVSTGTSASNGGPLVVNNFFANIAIDNNTGIVSSEDGILTPDFDLKVRNAA